MIAKERGPAEAVEPLLGNAPRGVAGSAGLGLSLETLLASPSWTSTSATSSLRKKRLITFSEKHLVFDTGTAVLGTDLGN